MFRKLLTQKKYRNITLTLLFSRKGYSIQKYVVKPAIPKHNLSHDIKIMSLCLEIP